MAAGVRISAQFTAAGKIFETTFSGISTPWGEISIDYVQGILIGCGVILFYTVAGGFLAVAMTDLVQGLIMAFSAVVLPAVGIWLACIMIAAAIAAVMSTVDSQILVAVSAVVGERSPGPVSIWRDWLWKKSFVSCLLS